MHYMLHLPIATCCRNKITLITNNKFWLRYSRSKLTSRSIVKSFNHSKQCTMGEIGGSHRHCYFIQPSVPYLLIWAIVGLTQSIVGIYGPLSIVARYCVTLWSHSQTRTNKKPVTFEPFEPQKRQSTKNDSTLHQKPICTIR